MLPSKFLLPSSLKLKPPPHWDTLSIWGSQCWTTHHMSSSTADGLSSILEAHNSRTNKPPRPPSIFGGARAPAANRDKNADQHPQHANPNQFPMQNNVQEHPMGHPRPPQNGIFQHSTVSQSLRPPPQNGANQNLQGMGRGGMQGRQHVDRVPGQLPPNMSQHVDRVPGQLPPNMSQLVDRVPGQPPPNMNQLVDRVPGQPPPNMNQLVDRVPGQPPPNINQHGFAPGSLQNVQEGYRPGSVPESAHGNQYPSQFPAGQQSFNQWNAPQGNFQTAQGGYQPGGVPGNGYGNQLSFEVRDGQRNGIGPNQMVNGHVNSGFGAAAGWTEGAQRGPQQWRNGIDQGPGGVDARYGNQGFNGAGHQQNVQNQFREDGGGNAAPSKPGMNQGAERQGNGVVTIQKPGQASQSYWRIDADTKPGGEYDSRWAKKMEQRFGQPAAQARPSPFQLIQEANANEMKVEKSNKPPKKEIQKEIVLPEDVTVKQLAQKLGIEIPKLEAVLAEVGEQPQSQEDKVSFDAAELAAAEFNKAVVRAKATGPPQNAVSRPAVVTVLGHVDHGKTTLLDSLRKTSVAAGEVGGITQHIGAFEVIMPDSQNSLTFLDTPGHAAFSAMRARGARVTDLVVLVVAADDGVMPQTREALRHAREANCPFVVAITKVDVPQANVARVKQQLMTEGIELEEFGGNIQVIEVAAPSGVGLQELEEALILQADTMELKAAVDGNVRAVVVEAHMSKGLGPVATIIVKSGTLKVGSSVAVGCQWGRVRVMKNADGDELHAVLPGKPAEICGLRGVPQAGDELMVVCNDERAKRVAEARSSRQEVKNWQSLSETTSSSSENASTIAGTEMVKPIVNIVLKADTKGTAEAVRDAILGLSGEVVSISVLYAGVGPVCEADVMFAAATSSSIMSFNLKPTPEVQHIAQEQAIDVRHHSIIYRLLDDVGVLMSDVAPLFEEEIVQGEASVLQVFELKGKRNKTGSTVAGCKVVDGHLQKSGGTIRVLRGDSLVHAGECASLKRHKLDVERVGKGSEFGAILDGFSTFQQGDTLQYVIVEKRKPKSEPVIGGGLRILPEPSPRKISA